MKKTRKPYINFLSFFHSSVKLGVIVLVIACSALVGLYVAYGKSLPSDQEILQWRSKEATRILDREGNVLYEIYGDEKRMLVPEDQIADTLKFATVSIEDARFYQHYGIDPKGIIRASLNNIRHKSTMEGGSTITQQLAKNTFLTPQRTITRKIREALLAYKMERHYSKDKILSLYLNQIGYGSNAYGAEAASRMYFGKHAKDLTLAESATLAALAKSPTFLSPYGDHTDRLIARRNLVINRMVELGYISPNDAKIAKETKLAVQPRVERIAAPHFVMMVKQQLIDKYGEDTVETGGLQVTTTLDPNSQKQAEDVVANSDPILKRSAASNTAMVALNPKNGEIVAMVGSRNYFNASQDGNVNVANSKRPPGSAFKPIIYAAGFDKGWAPGSTLFDLETNFGDEKLAYIPNNYDKKFHGPVSIREALANSYNNPAVKMTALVGKEAIIDVAKNLGITTLTEPERYGLSLALGGGDVKLVELAGAYGALANGGAFQSPTAITKITQGDKVLYEHKLEPKPVFRPESAYEVTSILSDPKAREPIFGLHGPLEIKNKTVAVKTGTTQQYRDAWTVGYTPSLVVGVWVGNNDFHPMKEGSAGAMAAAPIWNSYMTQALANHPDEQFKAPDGLEMVTVDTITGKLPTSSTRQTRQDIFASWQKPSNIQLASYRVYACDGGFKGERKFAIIHSEKPDNPHWEKPVIQWARSNGYPTSTIGDQHEQCPEPAPIEMVSTDQQSGVGGSSEQPVLDPSPIPSPTPLQITPPPQPDPTPGSHGRKPRDRSTNDPFASD